MDTHLPVREWICSILEWLECEALTISFQDKPHFNIMVCQDDMKIFLCQTVNLLNIQITN